MKHNQRLLVLLLPVMAAVAVLLPNSVRGSAVGTLPTFTAGGAIRASDFNSAFQTLRTSIDDNNTRIGNLGSLTTNAKGDLVAAINEVRSTAGTGTQGPMGAQGPAGPTKLTSSSSAAVTGGAGVNRFTTGTALGGNVNGQFPANRVAGRPFTATLRIQTTNGGADTPAPALTGGNLVVDIDWEFVSSAGAFINATQTNAGTIALSNVANNDVTLTITGTVPATPNTGGGLPCTFMTGPKFKVNGGTTCTGQANFAMVCDVTPP